MPESYFRAIAREEWAKDPWYNCKQAQAFCGLYNPHADAFHRYIRRGWIHAERRPGAGGLGEYVIRKSSIDAFLANDPRVALYHEHRSQAAVERRRKLKEEVNADHKLCGAYAGPDTCSHGL